MNKSVVIILSVIWLMCAMYLTLAQMYNYPYKGLAMAGSWTASLLLLVSVILYIRKHKNNKSDQNNG